MYVVIYTTEIRMCNKYRWAGTRERRFSIFDFSRFAINPKLSARSNSEHNDSKSVTDCFKRGLALSAAALAPENCLVLFPRATHLIKHACFSCSPDPSHLSFFHSASPLSHSHHCIAPRARRPSSVTRVYTHTHTHTRARAHTLYVSFCFLFPSSSFLLVMLQHLSLILVPLSSFVVNESLYLSFFLSFFLCHLRFFSHSFPFTT